MAPHHYRKRLTDNIPFEYDVYVDSPVLLGKSVVSVKTAIVLPNGKRSEANGTAVIQNSDGEITAEAAMYAVREAQSVGLKLALTNFGMGLGLYFNRDDEQRAAPKKSTSKPTSKPTPQVQEEDEDEEDAPPPKRKTTSSKPAGSNWESKREKFTYPMGKNKGTSYADLEANFLTWAEENLDPEDEKYGKKNADILKCVQDEIKYRKDNGEWAPKKKVSNKPTKKRSIGDDDDDTEF